MLSQLRYFKINVSLVLLIDIVVPGNVESPTVVLVADTTADHEAVLSVAQSLSLRHIRQLAVCRGSRTGRGEVEFSCDRGHIATELTSRQ